MEYANGSLTIPRVKVVWGDKDISDLVYEVRVSLDEQGQTPTGSMKWDPSAPGYSYYEKYIKEFKDWSIVVTFYYIAGNHITFEFYWGGQSEVYGKEMEITVKLVSFLDGLINANFYASAQTDVGEKGISYSDAVGGLLKQFGLTGNIGPGGTPLNIMRYTPKSWQDMNDSIVKFNYNDGATFMEAVQNLVKDNGNNVFFNNIGTANAVVFTPYSWEGEEAAVLPGWSRTDNPDPTKRYGYFIGPGIIQTFTRTYEWQPPQKSQEITAMMARKAEEKKAAEKAARDAKKEEKRRNRNNSNNTDRNAAQSASAATAPSGVYGSKTSGGIRSDKNENGPRKQDIFTKERAAKLSLSTLMCPSLVGLKPLDILFIPSYGGAYIEDWIVSSVEYQQNDKGVDLSIQATRPYGQGEPMSKITSSNFQQAANNLGLFSTSANADTLGKWVDYAWVTPFGGRKLPLIKSTPASGSPETAGNNTGSSGLDAVLNSNPQLPSNIVTTRPNLAEIKPAGMAIPNPSLYVINDPAYGAFLFEEQGRIKGPDGNPLIIVDATSNKLEGVSVGSFFATGKVGSEFFTKNYSNFLTFRDKYIDKLRNRFKGAGQTAQLNTAVNAPSQPAITSPNGNSPLKAGENLSTTQSTTGGTTTSVQNPSGTPTTTTGQNPSQQNVPASGATNGLQTTATSALRQAANSTLQQESSSGSPQTTANPTIDPAYDVPLSVITSERGTTLTPTSAVTSYNLPGGSQANSINSVALASYIYRNQKTLGVEVIEGSPKDLNNGGKFIVSGSATELRKIITDDKGFKYFLYGFR